MSSSFEYIYFRNVNLDEFLDNLNEFGEEGYHIIPQAEFGVFLLEREVPEEIPSWSTGITQYRYPWYPYLYLVIFSALILILLVAIVAKDFHWL